MLAKASTAEYVRLSVLPRLSCPRILFLTQTHLLEVGLLLGRGWQRVLEGLHTDTDKLQQG